MGGPGHLLLVSFSDSWMQPQASALHLAPSPQQGHPPFSLCSVFSSGVLCFVGSYEGCILTIASSKVGTC